MLTGSGLPLGWPRRGLQLCEAGVNNMNERANMPVGFKVLVVGNNGVLRRGIVQFLETLDISSSAGDASFESVMSEIGDDFEWDMVALDFEAGGDLAILKHIRAERP